jgi:C-terminal processing protease CtpA/Prc
MKADLDSLLRTIDSAHPDPTAYCGISAWQLAKERAYLQINEPLSSAAFGWVISEMLGTLQDSHTQLNYISFWRNHLEQGGHVLPIRKRGHWVIKAPKAGLEPGDELITIEKFSIDQIDQISKVFAMTEGNSFVSEDRMTDALFSLVLAPFVIQNKDSVLITFLDRNLQLQKKKVPTLSKEEWDDYLKELNKQKEEAHFTTEGGIGYLTIPSFAPNQFGHQHRVIKKAFKKIHDLEIDSLVIDLRNNAGGLSTEVEYLYSFLAPEGHNSPHNIISKSSALAQTRYPILNHSWIQKSILCLFKKQENIYNYVYLRSQPIGQQDTVYFHHNFKQHRNIFQGKVLLWVNGLSASAAVDFTHTIREEKRGEIWGEPVMGGMKGTFGNTTGTLLQHSKLQVQISTIRYNYDASWRYDPISIVPDIPVEITKEHITLEQDAFKELLKKRSNLRTP